MSDYCSEVEVSQHNASRPPPIALGINVEKPKFPQYAVYSKRLDSFKEWPEYLPIDRKDLVEAGLVYTGVGDSVRCYFCGGGLRNWEKGDVPMEEHAKWYTNCPHIMLVKGKAYVERLARGEKPEDTEKSSQQDKVDAIDYTNNVPAQSCIEMGYPKQMVRKAIDIYMERNGNKDFKGADLCQILFDIEENPERFDERSVCTEDVKHVAEEQETPSVEAEQYEPLDTLLEENNRLKENQMCKICLDSRADVIFLPCGHMVSCPQCAPALVKCPICRKTINGQLKAFFSMVNEEP